MFALKLETLSVQETAVVLSAAVTYFDENKKYTFTELVNDSCFVKFSVKEQADDYNRTVSSDTLKFWKEQSKEAKLLSLTPSEDDLSVQDGIDVIKSYIRSKTKTEDWVFTRGYFSQLLLTNLCNSAHIFPPFKPRQYMDFKTAISCLKENANNYGEVELPELPIIASNPIHENVRNIMMLLS